MSSDDLTRNKANADEDDKETQPTITAVFRLLQDVESRLTARLDEVESRLTSDIAGVNTRVTEVNTRVTEVNTRVTEGFKELSHKINALNRRGLQQEADYEDLFERIGRLESKAS